MAGWRAARACLLKLRCVLEVMHRRPACACLHGLRCALLVADGRSARACLLGLRCALLVVHRHAARASYDLAAGGLWRVLPGPAREAAADRPQCGADADAEGAGEVGGWQWALLGIWWGSAGALVGLGGDIGLCWGSGGAVLMLPLQTGLHAALMLEMQARLSSRQ